MSIYGTSLSIDAKSPMNRWDYDRIQPGAVGSVGDVHCQPRLKHSSPDMPIRWQKEFAGQNEVFLGSNVSDGQHVGYDSGGGPSRVMDSNWQSGRSFKTRLGWVMEDVTAPCVAVEPYVSSLGDYTWRNRVATVYEALRTGDQFLPLPGPYIRSAGEVPRAPQIRVTDVVPGDEEPLGRSVVYTGPESRQAREESARRARHSFGRASSY